MSCPDSDSTWFLAQYKPNCHRIAERNLRRQAIRTFLPVHEETKRSRGKFVTRTQPLFPGYLFVALNMAAGGWRKANSTFGISRLITMGAEPQPVPADLVAQLMLRCDHEGRLSAPKSLQPGDRVVVTKGALTEFVATVESIEPQRRVWVLLNFMGGAIRAEMSDTQLQSA